MSLTILWERYCKETLWKTTEDYSLLYEQLFINNFVKQNICSLTKLNTKSVLRKQYLAYYPICCKTTVGRCFIITVQFRTHIYEFSTHFVV